MSPRWVRMIALTVAASVAFSGLLVTAAEAKPMSYNFRGGTMYTLELQSPELPGSASTTRWGIISRSGKVTALSGDLGVDNVLQAVYSATDGLVYLIAGQGICELWSFDPGSPDETITREFVLSNPNPNVGTCNALALYPTTNVLMVGQIDDNNLDFGSYGYFFANTGAWDAPVVGLGDRGPGVIDAHWTDEYMVEFSYSGYFERSTATTEIEKKIRGRYKQFVSVRMDGNKTPWVLRYTDRGQYIGKFSAKSSKATWGKKLTDAVTGLPWFTASLMFIPGA